MRSLVTHLREPDAHDRLPFHPSCPICREMRLTGRLPTDELVSARTRALLAAGVLAVSSTAPAAVAIAAEQDQQQDGAAAVTPSTSDPADNPDFDPGGVATDLPQTAPPVPQAQAPAVAGNDDTAAVDQTPTTNPNDPVVDEGDGSEGTPAPPATPAPTATPPADPSAGPTTTATATPTPQPATTDAAPPVAETPGTTSPEPSTPPGAGARTVRRGAARSSRTARRSHHPAKPTAPSSAPATSVPSAPAAAATAPSPAPALTTVEGPRAKPGDDAHTVLRGESLWTIATDVLGSRASTAQVAREVHRLWQLNHDRIGTGDPDLLMVGTRLELR